MARDDVPSIREIADLTRRLRALSNAGHDADPAERAAFLADKDALITRIEAATGRARTEEHEVRPDVGLDREPLGAEHSATSDDDGEEWSR
jgi:hypothetical protein